MLKKYKDENRLKDFKFYLPFIAMLIFLIFLYQMDFPQGDDFYFTDAGGSFARIWSFYINYYLHSGSRMANMLAQVFLLSGLTVWKIVTPFVIEGISLLIYYYVTGRMPGQANNKNRKDFSLACVCATFPGLVPVAEHVFADTFVWMDGSCNYIYPSALMLLGFVPFYNTMRGRTVPRAIRFVSPVCLLAAAILHEQAAVLLAVMCAVCLIYFHKDKSITPYLLVLSCLAFAALIYTLTSPGAYARLGRAGNAKMPLPLRLTVNLLTYFYPFTSECWPWTVLMGICALFVMHRHKNGMRTVYSFVIFFGMLLFSLTGMLMYPGMQPDPLMHGRRFQNTFGYFEGVFLIAYFIIIFSVFFSAAKDEKKYRPLVVLYTGMWASQGIPAILGIKGRPLLYLVVMALVLTLCLFRTANCKAYSILKYAIAGFAVFTLVSGIPHMKNNMNEYLKIENNISMAKAGQVREVIIDRDKFDFYYAYYNSFSPRYDKSLHKYYKLPDNVRIIFLHG